MSPDNVALNEDIELQRVLDMKRAELEGCARKPAAKSWLGSCADSEEGTEQLLEELERRVGRDDFVTTLADSRMKFAAVQSSEPTGQEVLRRDWWETEAVHVGAQHVREATGDYVMVEHSDVVDAVAGFIAAYIVTLPEGRAMEPKQLQRAVQQSLKEIRKGRVKKLWDWGRLLYRVAAFGYGAFAAYTNPWIAEAVLKGLFTCLRYVRLFW